MSSRAARRRRSQAQHQRQVNKASYGAQARAIGAQTRDVSAQANALATMQQGQQIGPYQPLPRQLPYNAPFGPLTPLQPYGIDPLRPDGRTNPRQYEYPVGWNIPGAGTRHLSHEVLRAAARTDIVQDCMRVIRTELCGLDWGIVVSEQAIAAAAEQDGLRKVEAKQALRERLAPQMSQARDFWSDPDPDEGLGFDGWLWKMMEDVLSFDESAIYPQMTYGNDLCALWVLDSSTVKPLLSNLGRKPVAPDPAYQQILYGFPRGEFRAATTPAGLVDKEMSSDELIYSVRNVRPQSPYGYGPVENALTRINLWLKRVDFMTKQFDSNSLPLAFLELAESVDMEPGELRRWRQEINNQLAGDLAERQRIQLGLPGAKLTKFADNAELYRPEYDTFIVKLICASFAVTPAEIGFIETGGLGGASYHEGQENIQYRKMILPWCRWLQGIFNRVNRRYLGLDPAIEFRFLGLEEEDEAAADAVLRARVESGRMTLNEARDQQGVAPYADMPEADEPYILSRMGPQFLRGLQEQQEAQGEAVKAGAEMAKQNLEAGKLPSGKDPNTPKDERADGDEPTPDEGKAPTAKDDEDGNVKPPAKPAASKPGGKAEKSARADEDDDAGEEARQRLGIDGSAGDAQDIRHPFVPTQGEQVCLACGLADGGGAPHNSAPSKAAAAELDSFARWAGKLAKGQAKARPFAFTALDEPTARTLNHLVLDDAAADAASLAKATAAELRKQGGGGGRVESPRPERGAGGMARLPSPRPARPTDGRARLPGCQPDYRC